MKKLSYFQKLLLNQKLPNNLKPTKLKRNPTTQRNPAPKLNSFGQEFSRGLARLLLGTAAAVLAYGGWLLAPHLRESLYGYFGRPETPLDRAWNWFSGQLGNYKGPEDPTRTTSAAPTAANQNDRRLLEEIQKSRELLEGQKQTAEDLRQQQQRLEQQLERLSAEQVRTGDQLRWLSRGQGSSESWLAFMGKFMVSTGLSSFLGWFFGGKSNPPVTREDLVQAVESIAKQHTELDQRRADAQLVNDALTAQQFQALNFIESVVRGILHQVNTFALGQGLKIWVPAPEAGGGGFFDPNDPNFGGGGGNQPPGGGGAGDFPPPPPANDAGPILEEGLEPAAMGPAEAAAVAEAVEVAAELANAAMAEVPVVLEAAEAVAEAAPAVEAVEVLEAAAEAPAAVEVAEAPAAAAEEAAKPAEGGPKTPGRFGEPLTRWLP
jgi:hypothetical protein